MKKIAIVLPLMLLIVLAVALTGEIMAAQVYTVKTGDTLWVISQKLGVTVESIIERNNITDPGKIYIGQRLIIGEGNTQPPANRTNIRYTVKTGDLLWKIAVRYNVKVEDIIAANNIQPPYYIYIGQSLIIPVSGNNNGGQPAPGNQPGNGYFYYTIKPGDILWTIAQKYNTSVQRLVELNNIKNAYDLYIGRKLIVPANTIPADNSDNSNSMYAPYAFYRIQEGDQIWTIAEHYGVKVSTLIRYNNIQNINDLQVNQLLIIPLRKSDKFNYLKNASARLNNFYRVRSNETLADIAEFFRIPVEGIRTINEMTASEEVYTGQRLLMPVSPALFVKHELYTVKAGGEYIFDIAFNKGVSVNSILRGNYLRDANTKLKAGTVIVVSLDQNSRVTWIEYENGRPVNSIFGN